MARAQQKQIGSYEFKIMSFNVKGMQNENKRTSIFRIIRRKSIDMCLIQEAHCTITDECIWKNQWGGDIYFSHGSSNARGVTSIEQVKDEKGRFLSLKCCIQETEFKIINVYAPTTEVAKFHFFKDLRSRLDQDKNCNERTIIGGDFNLIRNVHLDRNGGNFNVSTKYKETIKILNEILEAEELNLAHKNPEVKRFTWRQHNPPISSRLH